MKIALSPFYSRLQSCATQTILFFRYTIAWIILIVPLTQAPTPTEKSKTQRDNTKRAINQRLRTDVGRSVGETAVAPLVWLNRFTSAQPSH